MIYVVLFLMILSIYLFYNCVKCNNYELNFKESIFYSIFILIVTSCILLQFINFNLVVLYNIYFYFFILLLAYYIVRYVKLKKYIPIKVIVGYLLIDIITLITFWNIEEVIKHIDGLKFIGLFFVYIVLFTIFIISLVLVNFVIFIIKIIKNDTTNYKNINYKISKLNFINIFILILLIGLILGIEHYIENDNNKLLQESKKVVTNYLDKDYLNYDFEMDDIYSANVNY